MRRLFFLLLLLGTMAQAQTRTYNDNASSTFVYGLEQYFYGASGGLLFDAGGRNWEVTVSSGDVRIGDALLDSGAPDVAVGLHDFTEDREPELVVARRDADVLSVAVYQLQAGHWRQVGQMLAPGGKDIRIFRQLVSIRRGSVLCSWTWHGGQFDYKASDGSSNPAL